MIDLSNNNGAVNFAQVHAHHQYRVYLKRSDGHGFVDQTFDHRYQAAHRAGLKVGAYHFARPSKSTPKEEADFFLRLLPHLQKGHDMRPCLDLEDPNAKPGPDIGRWAAEWLTYVYQHLGYHAIIYGGAYYLGPCAFSRHGIMTHTRLWLPAYGRNDGVEHPFVIPKPWTGRTLVAHQYASTARIPGVEGQCDVSHVFHPRQIDINALHRG